MIKNIWVCGNHYNALCEKVGHEIPVFTIANSLRSPCAVSGCESEGWNYINIDEKELEGLKNDAPVS